MREAEARRKRTEHKRQQLAIQTAMEKAQEQIRVQRERRMMLF